MMTGVTLSAVTASSSASNGVTVRGSLLFAGLLGAGLVAGLACAAWMRGPLKPSALAPAERQARFEQRRARLCLALTLLLYYAAALPVVVIQSGWSAVDPYLRGHLFDGFACAALLTVAWSQLTRPMPVRLRPAAVRIAAAEFLLPIASAMVAAAAAYVANGRWPAIGVVFCVAYIFSYKFWQAVVRTTGYEVIAGQNGDHPEQA